MGNVSLGWGIIGCGVIAPSHARAVLANAPKARLVGVCDVDMTKAEKLRDEFGAEFATDSIDELLSSLDIDCVSICTPSGLHAQCGIEAARAGKNILCEKPLDVSRERMDSFLENVHTIGIKLGCVFQQRTRPLHRKLRTMLASGDFGRVLYADLSGKDYRSPDYYKTASWRGTLRYDRGCLMNQGIHTLDLLLWLIGEPVVEAAGFWDHLARDIEGEDTIAGSLRFSSGALASVLYATSSSRGKLPQHIGIHCTEGNIILGRTEPVVELRGERLNLDSIDAINAEGQTAVPQGHEYHVADLIAALEEDRDPEITGESARTAVDVALALYEASDSRSAVLLRTS
ncbi:MAG: Gfo/Idh/MocA family oxidoreductase [Chloroflexi bacterium]|nr:Gfo/Idh/MocA family oxidoreductase [Chloroflexota bacterium]